jgi:pre-rRNA-processing protein RIX1
VYFRVKVGRKGLPVSNYALMAQTISIISASALRAVTVRLTNTPVKELPHIASHLAAGLVDCGEALSQNVAPGKEKSETRVLVHKLKTRVSSLLQDRTVEGRWTAVVLIKAIIELGGWEMLKTSESWVRGLVSILGVCNACLFSLGT